LIKEISLGAIPAPLGAFGQLLNDTTFESVIYTSQIVICLLWAFQSGYIDKPMKSLLTLIFQYDI